MEYTGFSESRIVTRDGKTFLSKKIDQEFTTNITKHTYSSPIIPASFEGKTVYQIYSLQPIRIDNSSIAKEYRKKYSNQITKWIYRKKDLFKGMGVYYALTKTELEYFHSNADSQENKTVAWYSKTYEQEERLRNFDFSTFDRAKVDRMLTLIMQIIHIYRETCEAYFETRQYLIYHLPPLVFNSYMQKRGSFRHVLYGVQMANNGWLNKSYGAIISPMYTKYARAKWTEMISRFPTHLPFEICALISEYVVGFEFGETFLHYFERIYDRIDRRIKLECTNCRIVKRTIEISHTDSYFVDQYYLELKQFI